MVVVSALRRNNPTCGSLVCIFFISSEWCGIFYADFKTDIKVLTMLRICVCANREYWSMHTIYKLLDMI